ncbi:MAG: peptidylprolyl isomerase [SAR86 cluster bacterium]|jgi:parvulin-like peptidyl-prolyl isomerase|nr:peptidylprolyl isomerase [SAR86 cluster bacterium]
MDDLTKHQSILGIGLIIGILLAALAIVEKNNITDQNWAAKIEDQLIPYERYQMQLEGLAKDKRSPLTNRDKEYVLERMIEEELLIKRAIDLGMLENNPMARGTIVQQMIKNIVTEGSRTEPQENELIEFFQENIGFFTKANRLRVRQIYFSKDDFGDEVVEKAKDAFIRLNKGENFEKVALSGSKSALKIPDTLMNLSKVREYIGPSLMREAQLLKPGYSSAPNKVSGGYKIIYLVDREDATQPEYSNIRSTVLSEFLKRRDDQSLRKYLDNLKNWYDVTRNIKE